MDMETVKGALVLLVLIASGIAMVRGTMKAWAD